MTRYPKDIAFKYVWRKYQQRVLDELQDHLMDKHLHVIAPPGSGKTVLGLEVSIRINKPTLILAPTIAIRNQWIQRLCDLFLQTTTVPDWISRDIRNPKFLTVVTYQGLHAACNNGRVKEDEDEDVYEDEDFEADIAYGGSVNLNVNNIVNGLKAKKIKTIVVDEAHHLKNEWWHTLSMVKDKLDPHIVGLTATPPYDVSGIEWQRYINLNGPVDTEISIPELIIEGDLCPHQDYVYFTFPTRKEEQIIVDFRKRVEKVFQEIKKDEVIIQALELHPIWMNPTAHLEWIYNNLAYYSAGLIFLNANNIEITKTHLEVIGDEEFKIPMFDYKWAETLLDFYLIKGKELFHEFEEHQLTLENRLRRYGVIERRVINFSYNKRVARSLTSSISKLNGIKDIVDFEYKQLGNSLRLVVLTDFIRKEFYVNAAENNLELTKIGVIPIFEKLRRDNKEGKKIGVLTGSTIIIPATAYPAFKSKAKLLGISQTFYSPVPFDSDYILISQTDRLKHDIVQLITQIFQDGEIEVLIGTKSLLGEGWDAPAINSLVLASFVGSFVLSNQMRGRAMRSQQGNSNKTGNIWHIACLDPTSSSAGRDFALLKRRFKTFVGVSFKKEPAIENGIGRLNLPSNIYEKEEAEKKNMEMFALAADRDSLKMRWEKALITGVNLVEEIKIPFVREKKYEEIMSIHLNKTIRNLLATLTSGVVGFAFGSVKILGKIAWLVVSTTQDMYIYLAILGLVGMLFYGRESYKALKLYMKYRDVSKDIKQIGNALLVALVKAKVIQSNGSDLKVEATVDKSGAVYCHLEGGGTFEKSIFINALMEIIAPIDNPRYVIIRKSKLINYIKQEDYHSVPEILGRNKNNANFFASKWQELVGECELIYTRTLEGRKLLLRSRIESLAAQFEDTPEQVNKWS